MLADVMYLSSDGATAVLSENKVGSNIGYGPAPKSVRKAVTVPRGGAQSRFCNSANRVVLVSGAAMLEANWYKGELQKMLNHMPDVMGACYTVAWGSIFRAKVG